MKNLDELKKQYEKLGKEIERLENGVDWEPERGERIWFVDLDGKAEQGNFYESALGSQNFFQTETQAQKAALLMKRSNAIIRACILVDSDYKPNWFEIEGTPKWSVFYDYDIDGWQVVYSISGNRCPSYVSTKEKAEQVCELLTMWGVK